MIKYQIDISVLRVRLVNWVCAVIPRWISVFLYDYPALWLLAIDGISRTYFHTVQDNCRIVDKKSCWRMKAIHGHDGLVDILPAVSDF